MKNFDFVLTSTKDKQINEDLKQNKIFVGRFFRFFETLNSIHSNVNALK